MKATLFRSARNLWIVALLPTPGFAQSPFNGVWRPDPQQASPTQPPDVYQLANGVYDCRSCRPPYQVKADGNDHPVTGNRNYDTLNVRVIDAHTLAKTAKQGALKVVESRMEISSDGSSLTEQQTLFAMGPHPVKLTSHSARLAPGTGGGHLVSGSWRRTETDLTDHDEDTTLRLSDGALSMSDKMGRSFTAKLDGTDAPYKGSDEFTTVSVKSLDATTIEESDKKDGKVVKMNRWAIDADGRTLHARFDDTHGHIQEQTAHRISP